MSLWAWGVDVDTRKISFGAWLLQDTRTCAAWEWRWRAESDRRLWAGADDLQQTVIALDHGRALMGQGYPPLVIGVERPTGRHPKPSLMATWGVTLWWLRNRFGCPVLDVAVSSWKKDTVGNGNASKEEVFAWATDAWGQPPLSQDMADALGIGVWAANQLEERP